MIELENLTKHYVTGTVNVAALAGVTLSIGSGGFVAIMGPSGSGKSTLMNIIGCLDVPTEGSYMLDGDDVGAMNDSGMAELRNRKIGFVFQTYNLLPRMTALANVELPLLYGSHRNVRERSMEALATRGSRGQDEPQADRAFRRAAAACGDREGAREGADAASGR